MKNMTTSWRAEVVLGVIIDDKLKFEAHIQTKINKANQIMGIIRRTFKHLDCKMFVPLFKAMVRPHVEYAQSVWSP
jgi:hypothetical protein